MKGTKEVSMIVKCEDCGRDFKVSTLSGAMTFRKRYMFNEQALFISYYECPNCGRRYYAQVDNYETISKLKSLSKRVKKLSMLKQQNKEASRSWIEKFDRDRKHLKEERRMLIEKILVKPIMLIDAETGNPVKELRFKI